MNETQMVLSEAAQRLGVKPYRITYALANGLVEDVPRVGNRRMFGEEDIMRLARHFGLEPNPNVPAASSLAELTT